MPVRALPLRQLPWPLEAQTLPLRRRQLPPCFFFFFFFLFLRGEREPRSYIGDRTRFRTRFRSRAEDHV
jgi:hypothetical protein